MSNQTPQTVIAVTDDLLPMPTPTAGPALAAAGEPAAAPRLRKANRFQVTMECRCPDELVPANHRVRVLWQVMQQQDWSAFWEPIKAREGIAGRDATDPCVLATLWLYATSRSIGSARELDRQCKESNPYKWILGGLTVNYHLLADFRVSHADALDSLFTDVLAVLVDKKAVSAEAIGQDGVRVRGAAGASSFRGEQRLQELHEQAKAHVAKLRALVDDPAESAKTSAGQKAARLRGAEEKQRRVEAALAELPELKRRQEETAKRAGNGERGKKIREKKPRVSTTDPESRVMKMANGGFNPAVNVQVATDLQSRAIVGVEVSNEGSDSAGLAEPMRQQVEERTGQKVDAHTLDGGYLTNDDIERAFEQGVALHVPAKPARNAANRGKELEPKPKDSPAIADWKQRMSSPEGRAMYKLRGSTNETANADLRYRGLRQFAVRGLKKAKCVVLWCALAYNIALFAQVLLS